MIQIPQKIWCNREQAFLHLAKVPSIASISSPRYKHNIPRIDNSKLPNPKRIAAKNGNNVPTIVTWLGVILVYNKSLTQIADTHSYISYFKDS